MFKRLKKGQSTLEYIVVIIFVATALIAMSVYIKRGVQGRLRTSTDQIGQQYSAKHTTSGYETVIHLEQVETMKDTGETATNITENSQTKIGLDKDGVYETVADFKAGM